MWDFLRKLALGTMSVFSTVNLPFEIVSNNSDGTQCTVSYIDAYRDVDQPYRLNSVCTGEYVYWSDSNQEFCIDNWKKRRKHSKDVNCQHQNEEDMLKNSNKSELHLDQQNNQIFGRCYNEKDYGKIKTNLIPVNGSLDVNYNSPLYSLKGELHQCNGTTFFRTGFGIRGISRNYYTIRSKSIDSVLQALLIRLELRFRNSECKSLNLVECNTRNRISQSIAPALNLFFDDELSSFRFAVMLDRLHSLNEYKLKTAKFYLCELTKFESFKQTIVNEVEKKTDNEYSLFEKQRKEGKRSFYSEIWNKTFQMEEYETHYDKFFSLLANDFNEITEKIQEYRQNVENMEQKNDYSNTRLKRYIRRIEDLYNLTVANPSVDTLGYKRFLSGEIDVIRFFDCSPEEDVDFKRMLDVKESLRTNLIGFHNVSSSFVREMVKSEYKLLKINNLVKKIADSVGPMIP